MPTDLIHNIVSWLNSIFGAHFIQPLLLMSMALFALNKGVRNVMKWAEDAVLEPYFRPFVQRLDTALTIQTEHTDVLTDHEVRIHDTELDVAMLQGKILGGRATLDVS